MFCCVHSSIEVVCVVRLFVVGYLSHLMFACDNLELFCVLLGDVKLLHAVFVIGHNGLVAVREFWAHFALKFTPF